MVDANANLRSTRQNGLYDFASMIIALNILRLFQLCDMSHLQPIDKDYRQHAKLAHCLFYEVS